MSNNSQKTSDLLLEEALNKADEIVEMILSGQYVRLTDHTSELYDQINFLKERLTAYYNHQDNA